MMDGNQDKKSNIKSKYGIPRKFHKTPINLDRKDYNQFYQDVKLVAMKWDFNHKWNYVPNLILYRKLYDKYSFIEYQMIKAVANEISLFCRNCGTILKNPLTKSGLCRKCAVRSKERCEKISQSKRNMSSEALKKSIERRIETTIRKYGVPNISQDPRIIAKIKKSLKARKLPPLNKETVELINIKKYNTHKENNSFRTSNPEEFSIFIIKEIFEVIPHHFSKEYPFECDLYLPQLDLYIELNYSWTHGGHSYNSKDPKDQKVIKEIQKKEKGKAYYMNMLETWTIRDPLKRETVRKNNLNWLEFFSMEEFLTWLWDNFRLEFLNKFPKMTLENLKKAHLCYRRSGNSKHIPVFKLNNKLIVNQDIKKDSQFCKDWEDKEKRKQVIRYMLREVPEELSGNYLSNFAANFFKSGITCWRDE